MKLTIKNLDIKNIDRIFDARILEHIKKFEFCLVKCEFKLVLNDSDSCEYVMSKISDNKTRCSWQKFLENVFNNFKNEGYNFNHIAEVNIITVANELDMSYDFYFKHIMCALEWKLNVMINKSKKLINKLDRSKHHPLIRKFSHVPICN